MRCSTCARPIAESGRGDGHGPPRLRGPARDSTTDPATIPPPTAARAGGGRRLPRQAGDGRASVPSSRFGQRGHGRCEEDGGATAWATAPGAAARGGCSGVPSYTGAARWRAPRISNSRASRIAPASGRAGTGVRALGRQRDHLMSPPTAAENSFTRSSALTFFLPASRSRSCSVRSASRVPDTLH